MSIPNSDPSLPTAVNPYFQDNGFVRGDELRNNNAQIWGNLDYFETNVQLLLARFSNYQAFTTSGALVIPASIIFYHMIGCGGGGGGGDDSPVYGGGGGSSGEEIYGFLNVISGTNYLMSLGTGGAGATSVGGTGNAGGTARIIAPGPVTLITATGGSGGLQFQGGISSGRQYTGQNGSTLMGGNGGGGGGGLGGVSNPGSNGVANSGGGGGGGSSNGGANCFGGNGADGFIEIWY